MLTELLHDLNLQDQITDRQLNMLGAQLNTVKAWQVLNYLCFVQDKAPIIQDYQERQQQLLDLQLAQVSEVTRLQELNQLGLTMGGSEHLTRIQTEKNQRQFQDAQRYPALVLDVGRYVIAAGFVQQLLQETDEVAPRASWQKIYQELAETPLFSIHPLIAAQLEKLAEQGIDEDTEVRHFLWSEAIGKELPTEKSELDAAILYYQQALDLFAGYSTEAAEYVNTLGVKDDERYFHLIEMIPYTDPLSYQEFLQTCTAQAQPEHCRAFLRLTANRLGFAELSDTNLDLIAQHFPHESEDHLLEIHMGKPFGLGFIFSQYLQYIQPEVTDVTEVEPAQDLFNKGRLPNFRSEEYAVLLPKLLAWARLDVEQRGRNRGVTISPDRNATIPNAIVDLILNGIKIYEDDFARILNPIITGNGLEWSIADMQVMAIVIEFETRRWGGGGIKDSNRQRFISDLKQLSERL